MTSPAPKKRKGTMSSTRAIAKKLDLPMKIGDKVKRVGTFKKRKSK